MKKLLLAAAAAILSIGHVGAPHQVKHRPDYDVEALNNASVVLVRFRSMNPDAASLLDLLHDKKLWTYPGLGGPLAFVVSKEDGPLSAEDWRAIRNHPAVVSLSPY